MYKSPSHLMNYSTFLTEDVRGALASNSTAIINVPTWLRFYLLADYNGIVTGT